MGSSRLRGLALAAPPILVVALFIGFPVLSSLLYTLGHTGGMNSVVAEIAQHQYVATQWWGTVAAYRDVFHSGQFWRSVLDTLSVTVASTAGVLVLATAVALYVRLSGSWLARALSVLAVIPMFVPVVIASYAILEFYAPDGFVRSVAQSLGWSHAPVLSYTMAGVTIGQIWTSLPFGVLLLTSAFGAVPDALLDAAHDAGASTARVIRDVLVPMATLPMVIVGTFTSIAVLGSFTVPYLIGPTAPNMLGPLMANTFSAFNEPQQAEVMSVVLCILAAGAGIFYVRANFRSAKKSGVAR